MPDDAYPAPSQLPETLAQYATASRGSPEAAFDVLRRYLDDCEIASKKVAPHTLQFTIAFGDRLLHCLAGISTEPTLLVFYVYYDQEIPEDRRKAFGQLVLHANYDLPVGSFELDPSGARLRLRSSLMIGPLEMSTPLVCSVIEPALWLFTQYLVALDAVFCEADPAEAVATLRAT